MRNLFLTCLLLSCAPIAMAQDVYPAFAVVELFTSEGCSSCPPADALLAKLDAIASKEHRPIYVLSMHVDYWNGLGWRDPFSQKEFTRRQWAYADILGATQVYTPQMVINGLKSFNGADASQAIDEINQALKTVAKAKIALQVKADDRKIGLTYQIQGDYQGTQLHVCLIQLHASSDVTQGENAGRQMAHVNIVRDMKTLVASTDRGSIDIDRSILSKAQQGAVVAFLQDSTSGAVLAAARVELPAIE